MALSDDQMALLRLLAWREDGYEDIAALKGISVAEMRAEVNAALDELGSEPEPAPAKPAPPEPPAPEPPAPKPPTASKQAPAAETPVRAAQPGRRLPSVPPERRRLLALTAGALGIVAVVLIAITVLGGDSGPDTSTAGGSGEATETASAEGGGLTQATLEPVGGSDASGQAVFGRVGKEEVVLQVAAENLDPAQGGSSYTVWLYRSPQLALRVGSAKVGDPGRLGARFPIPTELLAYVASGAFKQIKVSRTSDADYEAKLAKARKQKALPPYSGETVLRGRITGPIVRAGANQGG